MKILFKFAGLVVMTPLGVGAALLGLHFVLRDEVLSQARSWVVGVGIGSVLLGTLGLAIYLWQVWRTGDLSQPRSAG